MPLSFVLTTIVCMFVGSTVFQFSKYVPSSGGYYSFATRGLGSRSGFMATWSYLIYEIIGAAAAVGFWLPALRHVESGVPPGRALVDCCIGDDCTDLGTHSPWYPAFSADHDPLRRHRTAHYVGAWDHLSGPSRPRFHLLAPLTPAASPHHFGGILAGMVSPSLLLPVLRLRRRLLRRLAFPAKFIGQAVMLSLVSIGAFYIFMSYASAIGWGTGDMASFASNPIRTTFSAVHNGGRAGGSSSSPSSTALLLLESPALTPRHA